MNELEQLKFLVDDFLKEADAFIERQKQYRRGLPDKPRQTGKNRTQVNNHLNAIKHG